MPFHDRGDQPLQVLQASGVGGYRLGLATEAAVDTSRLDVQAFLLPARQHDLRALLRQRLGDGAADAAAGSGHESDASG